MPRTNCSTPASRGGYGPRARSTQGPAPGGPDATCSTSAGADDRFVAEWEHVRDFVRFRQGRRHGAPPQPRPGAVFSTSSPADFESVDAWRHLVAETAFLARAVSFPGHPGAYEVLHVDGTPGAAPGSAQSTCRWRRSKSRSPVLGTRLTSSPRRGRLPRRVPAPLARHRRLQVRERVRWRARTLPGPGSTRSFAGSRSHASPGDSNPDHRLRRPGL